MAEKNLAVVLHGPNQMKLENVAVLEPNDNDVLIKMGSVGICGSDLKYWKYAKCGRFTMSSPMVIGHEGSGTVVKCGSLVKTLKEGGCQSSPTVKAKSGGLMCKSLVATGYGLGCLAYIYNQSNFLQGDRVAIEPGVPCRKCYLCRSGRYNLCKEMRFCATPPVDGNLCQYYKHPEDFCFNNLGESSPLPNIFQDYAIIPPVWIGQCVACDDFGYGYLFLWSDVHPALNPQDGEGSAPNSGQ